MVLSSKTVFLLLAGVHAIPVQSPFDPSVFDTSVSPGDDFYAFVNNYWLKKATIADDKTSNNSFQEVANINEKRIKDLLESADLKDPVYSNRLIADLYKSGMDLEHIEETARDSIQPFLEEIEHIECVQDAFTIAMSQKKKGISRAFFGLLDASPDLRNSTISMAYVSEGGIGLPRSYYFDPAHSEKLLKYSEYLQKLLIVGSGYDKEAAVASSAAIVELEIQIANATYTPVERRDIQKQLNYYQWTDLESKFPGIPWSVLPATANFDEREIGEVVIDHPSFYIRVAELLRDTPLSTIKSYMRVCLLGSAIPYLSKEFTDIGVELSKALSGIVAEPPRFKKVAAMLDSSIGNAIGRLYVQKYFPPEAKADVLKMIEYIREILRDRIIKEMSWMSEATKGKALEKLAAMGVKIGYPDKWDDFSALESLIDPDMTLLEKFATISQWNYETELAKTLNKLVDKSQWLMYPHQVNAYFLPSGNEIVFPAAILTPPFYYPPTGTAEKDLENSVKSYAAIGAVIGHEIGHAFDDKGRQYGKTGNLESWWTDKDAELFKQRASQLVSQYNQFQIIGKNVSGLLTLGENIADLGGCVTSFYAMKKAFSGHSDSLAEGLTNEQRYFVYYARLWKSIYRDATLIRLIETDPHSPSKFRVNGVISNMKEFYAAFGVKKGNLLYREPEDRVEIF